MNIFKQTFDAEDYHAQSKEETYLCQKYEDLIEHVKHKALEESQVIGRDSFAAQQEESRQIAFEDLIGEDAGGAADFDAGGDDGQADDPY